MSCCNNIFGVLREGIPMVVLSLFDKKFYSNFFNTDYMFLDPLLLNFDLLLVKMDMTQLDIRLSELQVRS